MTRTALSITAGVIVALLAIAGVVVYTVPVFTVDRVEVEGAGHVSQEQVEQASGLTIGENLVRVDAQQAATGIAGLPWVKSVTVERAFPSTVHVELTERTAVAYTDSTDGPHLIDAEGEEFIIDTPPAEAVELTGGESGSENWRGAVAVLAALPADLRAQAQTLDTADKYNYVFRLKDDRIITWGANEDNANKARAFAAVLKMEGQEWNISNPELVSSK
ncbi:FtsQ-type POTRA domain-containing protein [uncultured Corynebacterium sp.]|uniref:cell division protein FtsQ/DivIB n=1 Tax=uncultured Corynebacterium sp. TaxID=159447 RepID=UPI0025FAF223|nr:FtsQ-type POTRA domain-containing protein [uncultured Corynebacterium sp.]